MVEAAGVEPAPPQSANWLMARDFSSELSGNSLPCGQLLVLSISLESSPVLEICWRRSCPLCSCALITEGVGRYWLTHRVRTPPHRYTPQESPRRHLRGRQPAAEPGDGAAARIRPPSPEGDSGPPSLSRRTPAEGRKEGRCLA